MAKYVLNYFNVKARGEFARLIFAASGVKYNDKRFDFLKWKPQEKADAPLGQLPYLEVNNTKIPQSITIARYIAKENNLYGKDSLEQAKSDAVVDTAHDLMNAYFPHVFKAENKEEAIKKFQNETAPKIFGNLEKLIDLYGKNGFSVGSSLTWADLYVFDVIDQFFSKQLSILDAFPRVKNVYSTVSRHAKISDYLKNRKYK